MSRKENKKPKSIKRRLRNIFIILVIFFLMNMIAARIIFHFIFARYEYYGNNIDPVYSMEDAKNYPREDVSFQSGRNTLYGRLYSVDDPNGIVILAHGMHSYGDRYLDVTEYFIDRGWCVFTYDMTGTRDSEGFDTVGLPQMRRDVTAAIRFVQNNPATAELPIVLYGHSMGGYAVATAIATEKEIAGVVCISAFDRPTDIMLNQAAHYAGFAAKISYPFMWLQNRILFGRNANERASDVLQKTQIPVLVIQGNSDDTIPEKFSLYAKKDTITNPRVTFLLVDAPYRGEHSTLWLTSECAEYTLAVHEQLDALDKKYHRKLPDDVYDKFMQTVDMNRLYVLDEAFMGMINEFFLQAVDEFNYCEMGDV